MKPAAKTSCLFCAGGLALTMLAPQSLEADYNFTRSEIKKIIEKAEETADDFDDDFDDGMDNTGIDGTDEEERMDRQAEALEDTLDEIRKEFNNGEDRVRMRTLVSRAVSIASDLDRIMTRYRFNNDVESDWSLIRNHLNSMAEYYGARPLVSRNF